MRGNRSSPVAAAARGSPASCRAGTGKGCAVQRDALSQGGLSRQALQEQLLVPPAGGDKSPWRAVCLRLQTSSVLSCCRTRQVTKRTVLVQSVPTRAGTDPCATPHAWAAKPSSSPHRSFPATRLRCGAGKGGDTLEPLETVQKRLCWGSEQLLQLMRFPGAFARCVRRSSVEGGSQAARWACA